jgi:DNA-binding transcriptional MocR family regulator
MAIDLNVSIQTVSRAYDDLTRRGLLSGEPGRGTFVKSTKLDRGPPFTLQRLPEVIDLSILKPVCENVHEDRMRSALASLATDLPSRAVHAFRPESAGSPQRSAAVEWLRLCGVETSAYNVCITNGATSALAVALMTVAPSGSTVATEVFGHHSLKPLANYLGIKLIGVRGDHSGILPDQLAKVCGTTSISALVLQPTVINPTAILLSDHRRREIAEIAKYFNVTIVENDPLGPLVSNKPATIFSIATDQCFYVTSFTKIIMPGLRIGYMAVPSKYAATAMNRHLVTNWMATPLVEQIATNWVFDGTAIEFVEWQRQALGLRHALFNRLMGDFRFTSHPQSLHAWIPLPDEHQEAGFVEHAKALGVAVARGSSFLANDTAPYPAIRVSVGSVTFNQLTEGLSAIAKILNSLPEPPLSTP